MYAVYSDPRYHGKGAAAVYAAQGAGSQLKTVFPLYEQDETSYNKARCLVFHQNRGGENDESI